VLYGGSGADNLTGGAGADTLTGGVGIDSLYGGAGADSIIFDADDAAVFGGSGDDILSAVGSTAGVNLDVTAAQGEVVYGSSHGDTLDASGSSTTIVLRGYSGDDSLTGGSGADIIYGDSGADTITSSAGNDTLYGGANSDLFKILGAGNMNLVGGENSGDDDVLDLSTLGAAGQIASITFNSGDDEAGTVTFVGGEVLTFSEMETVICFAAGTRIKTAAGYRRVENLRIGDLIRTLDRGMQPIRWIGRREVAARGNLAPIRIRKNALGNDRDILVSPQHRMLIRGWRAEMLYGEPEVLVAAKHLINDDTILREPAETVTYVHLCFDHHEIIDAEGALTESFLPGAMGRDAIPAAQLDELYAIFPELREDIGSMPPARRSLKAREARLLHGDVLGLASMVPGTGPLHTPG
jgi:hypothetical protein